jgi:hypothetical protein
LLAARFKLGSNRICTLNNIKSGLLGLAKPHHVPAQVCDARVIKTERVPVFVKAIVTLQSMPFSPHEMLKPRHVN